MRVHITGSSGFIGSHLTAAFREAGHEVSGSSRSGRQGALAWDWSTGPAPLGDLDVLVHNAALSSPFAARSAYHRDNVEATRHALEAARRSGCRRFLYISSSSVVYRPEDQLNLDESTPPPETFVNRYAETKYAGELLVRSSGLPFWIIRPRAVFGPGDRVLLPRILRAARAGLFPDFGRPVRSDLVYVRNLADLVVQAAQHEVRDEVVFATNQETVEIDAFLQLVFAELKLKPRRPRVPVPVASALAGALEGVSTVFTGARWEPPLTRFGVSVFAYSKTFSPDRQRLWFGTPRWSLRDGLRETLAC